MNRPVVIVDPLSAGVELAPAFNARGVPVIAVTLNAKEWTGFGSKIHETDFVKIIPEQPELVEILRECDPIAIIPGTEEGILLAEQLSQRLTPHLANDPDKSLHRRHKAFMQVALEEAGITALKTINTASESDVEQWITVNGLANTPLIVKPPMSAGSDKVFHIAPGSDWRVAFNRVRTEPSQITGELSETVVVQEQVIGTEFAVGTVSHNGHHYLAHLIQYHKRSAHDRDTLFDYVEFIDFDVSAHGELFAYTKQVLDALGIRWGAAHTEIMLTKTGPRLIESGARMCGGPVVGFAREATGSSQADKLVEAYVDGTVAMTEYCFKKFVVPVFLKSPAHGRVSNSDALAATSKLPTFLTKYIWFKDGDIVPQTVDYLTSIGIVALAGDRENIRLDYEKIRQIESMLIVSDVD